MAGDYAPTVDDAEEGEESVVSFKTENDENGEFLLLFIEIFYGDQADLRAWGSFFKNTSEPIIISEHPP